MALLGLSLLAGLPVLATPQGPPGGERPTIGLVLSGGGARGCAHAGALEGLEELRVPVDRVVGSSIGAVVGGFYAAGRSPEEIQAGLAAVDWGDLFAEQPAYRDRSMRRKADARRTMDLELGIGLSGASFPPSLFDLKYLDVIFRRETLPALGVEDFDRLPIPFRAVATDLESGRPLLLGSGDLPTAMLASMAIPGVFAPVHREGRILVDGSLTRDLPLDAVQALGAEVILAVDTTSPLLEAEELESIFGILGQMIALLGAQESQEEAAAADLLLEPELEGVSGMDFERCDQLFGAGVEAVRRRAGELSAYSLSPAAWEAHRAQRASRTVPPPTTVAAVRIEGLERLDERRVLGLVRTRAGSPFDLEAIAEDQTRLFGLGEFEQVQVTFERAETPEAVTVRYRVREKTWGPNIVRFGLFAADDLEGSTQADLLIQLTRAPINRRGGEWRLELQAGRTRRLGTELYQPLDFEGRFFAALGGERRRTLTDVYAGDRKVAEYAIDAALGALDLGWTPSRSLELRAGLRRGQGAAKVSVGAIDLPRFDDVGLGSFVTSLTFDRLDSPDLPRRGAYAALVALTSRDALGADDDYEKVYFDGGLFTARGPHGVFLQGALGASPGSQLPAYDEFTLGGIRSLSGFGEGQLRTQSFGVLRLGYSYRVFELPPALGGAVYALAWTEAADLGDGEPVVGRPEELDGVFWTGTVALALETRLGPLYVAYGAAEGGFDRVYAALGKRF